MLSLTRFIELESLRQQSDRESMAASWTPEQHSAAGGDSLPPVVVNTANRMQLERMLRLHGLMQAGEPGDSNNGEYSNQSGISLAEIATNHQSEAGEGAGSSDSQDELAFLNSCKEAGVVYILGNNVVKARKDSGFFKKLAIDYIYTFLRRLSRDSRVVLNIPHECLLQVGMVYYV